jgi:DNA polymerase III sliding clamp (beta) subunit (PCNA family)
VLIAFNSQYVQEFLKVAESPSVRLEFKDEQSARELRPEETLANDRTFRYVVMPIRL